MIVAVASLVIMMSSNVWWRVAGRLDRPLLLAALLLFVDLLGKEVATCCRLGVVIRLARWVASVKVVIATPMFVAEVAKVMSVLGGWRECRRCVLLRAIMTVQDDASFLVGSFWVCLIGRLLCTCIAVILGGAATTLRVMTLWSFWSAILKLLCLFSWRYLLRLVKYLGSIVRDASRDGKITLVESHRCDWLVSIFTHGWHHRELTLLPVLHHDVLIKRDLMGSQYLLITARFLLLHSRAGPMVRGPSLTMRMLCLISIVWVPSCAPNGSTATLITANLL